MVTLIKIIFLTLVIFSGFYLAMVAVTGASANESNRLKRIKHEFGEGEENKSFSERLIKPVYDQIFNFFSRFTPNGIQEEYDQLLTDAGLRRDYTPIRFVTNQVLLALTVGVLSFLLMRRISGEVNLSIFAVLVIVSVYYPVYHLRKKVKDRREQILNDLPNVLDMVYISVEAGLSFDAAMVTTASKMEGELSDEIMRAMEEINRGRAREDALYSISERTGVSDVRSFISTIIQSEKLGSNISNVLRIQAEVIRDKRKQRIEETINKMPIKMLLPLVFFLLPALFVVIMGPSIINVLGSL